MRTGIYVKGVKRQKPAAIRAINAIISSPIGVLLLGVMSAAAFAFSMEVPFYCFVVLYAIYVAIFARDLSPLMPLFIFCYITPSASNNPGTSKESIFYGASGAFLLALVAIGVTIIFIRIGTDKKMGFSRLFTKKRKLALGMLLLGVAYMLSGINSLHYGEYMWKNLLFSFIQFASIFLLYFVLSATVRWKKFNVSYLATIGLTMGFIVAFEIVWIYVNGGIFEAGEIVRSRIFTGWGIYNNLGAIITMSIPFAFYFVSKSRFATPFFIAALVLLLAAFMTCSRGASLFAVIVFSVCYVMSLKNAVSKWELRIVSILMIIGSIALAVYFKDELSKIYERVPHIIDRVDGKLLLQDNERFGIYRDGIGAFLDAPIFGQTFYPIDYSVYDFATLDEFSSFFPPRWHNTVIQILASAGLVGIAAYITHRVSTVVLFVKRRSRINTYIAISILALLGMSLVDCHFFNVGPVLFYSTMLAVAEFGREKT